MNCEFGSTSKGEKARLYILRNQRGMEIAVTDYGAALVKVLVPDKDGKVQDVVLGYDNAKAYENGGVYFGATVGTPTRTASCRTLKLWRRGLSENIPLSRKKRK